MNASLANSEKILPTPSFVLPTSTELVGRRLTGSCVGGLLAVGGVIESANFEGGFLRVTLLGATGEDEGGQFSVSSDRIFSINCAFLLKRLASDGTLSFQGWVDGEESYFIHPKG